jgi:hypothetical protein
MSYLVRMSYVCSAAFFLVHLALGAAVRGVSPRVTRAAERMQPAAGARLLFALRMLPWVVSLAVVLALCVPSYLRFEQDAAESVGLPCLVLSGICFTMLAASAVRGVWALLTLNRLAMEPGRALFALVGFVRPRLVISAGVRETLSAGQMEAALLHEDAHRRAGDNWKRLAMLLTPEPLPGLRCFRMLETQWARLAEWAADDAAVQAEPLRAVALAEAMLRVARIGGRQEGLAPVSMLVASGDDLGQRVQRLLDPEMADAAPRVLWPRLVALGGLAAVVVAVVYGATVLYVVHTAMERLVQ